MEASSQWSTIYGAYRACASIAIGVRPLRSWRHNALQLTKSAEHWQLVLVLMDFNIAPLQWIYINENININIHINTNKN